MSERWFMDGLVTEGKREQWQDGLKAWVYLYYDEFTDATEIERAALDALESLHHGYFSTNGDVSDAVRAAEQEINDAGGVMSATTNERHPVRTPGAWEEEPGPEIKARLEYLRGELRGERISQGELIELQGLADYVEPGDVELAEAAGIDEQEFHTRTRAKEE